jgi:hypothetical protein
MKVEDAKKIVLKVEEIQSDNEAAHEIEDEAINSFISSIKNGKYNTLSDVEEVAKELYKLQEIDYERWYS